MMRSLSSLLKNDDMQRDILFVLNYIRHGFMATDQQAVSTLKEVSVHLKGLLIERSTRKWKEGVEGQVQEILDMLQASQ